MDDKELLWQQYQEKQKELMLYGFRNGMVDFYNQHLIEKLRHIYYGGVPASLLLLCNYLSNGHCCDRALLLSRAFLEETDDVHLIYALVDGIRLNPRLYKDDPNFAKHCFLERITSNNQSIIYDTSMGLVFTKELYWMIENPQVTKINTKAEIKQYLKQDPESKTDYWDAWNTSLILPVIESNLDSEREIYACEDFPLLQTEIAYARERIEKDESYQKEKKKMKRKKEYRWRIKN